MNSPVLVEPTIKMVLNSELRMSNEYKFEQNSLLLNIGLFIAFIVFFSFVLWYCYKGKQDPFLNQEKEKKKREYILSKLQHYQKMKQEAFTNIPF
jgi:phosphotransferase system  glucose/maltose/N-acetylglucosamine-specific IIC component